MTESYTIRKQKRKKKRRILILSVILSTLLLLAAAAVSVNVTEITVTGNEHYSKDEIRDILFGTKKDRNSLYAFLNYRFGEQKTIPFVEKYRFDWVNPQRIDVIVYEKAVAGYIEYMGSYMYFDKDGIIVESSSMKTEGLPLITGLNFSHIVLHERLPVENEAVFKEVMELTQLCSKYELAVDKIYFDSNFHAVLYLGDLRVRLGDAAYLDGKVAALKDMLNSIGDLGAGTLFLDGYTEAAVDIPSVFKPDASE